MFFWKVNAAHNKQHAGPSNAVRLDQETEELRHEKLDLQVGKVIQQARNAKNITQVELARVVITSLAVIWDKCIELMVSLLAYKREAANN